MIRPITQRLFGILVATVCLIPIASAHALSVEPDATPPTRSFVLDPSTCVLIGLGLVGLAVFRRRSHGSDEG